MEKNELYHYGVPGMRWGVRRTPKQLGHQPAKKAKEGGGLLSKFKKKKQVEPEEAPKKKKSLSEMSDAELKEKINRLELEKRYADAVKNSAQQSKGRQFLNKVVSATSDKVAENVIADLAAQSLKSLGVKGINKLFGSEEVFTNNKKKS